MQEALISAFLLCTWEDALVVVGILVVGMQVVVDIPEVDILVVVVVDILVVDILVAKDKVAVELDNLLLVVGLVSKAVVVLVLPSWLWLVADVHLKQKN
jgi:hypothetical protein